jgi:two-component system KDP operon response regulator KdpE
MMSAITILVHDEQDDLTQLLQQLLSSSQVVQVERKCEIMRGIQRYRPDLLILDPTALDVCECVRSQQYQFPILVLGTEDQAHVSAQALDLGADDFMHAPLEKSELKARIKALLRRSLLMREAKAMPATVSSQDGHVQLYVPLGYAFVGGKRVWLSKTEQALLYQLMSHAERVMTKQSLLTTIWGSQYAQEWDYLRTYTRLLRRKIEPDPSHPRYIQTVCGVGYIFRS